MPFSDDMERLLSRDPGPPTAPAFAPPGAPAFVGRCVSTGTALGVGKFIKVNPVAVLGAETEGGAGSLSVFAGKSVIVHFLGPQPPVTGEDYVCVFTGFRWEAWKTGGASGVTIPNCNCTTTPPVLTMVSHAPACSGGSLFFGDTIRWTPIPAPLTSLHPPLGNGTNAFLGDTTFTDGSGFSFRYYLSCSVTEYDLARVYPVSPFGGGGPFKEGTRYSWVTSGAGSAGNSCSPFVLANGTVFLGGDPTCSVSISG